MTQDLGEPGATFSDGALFLVVAAGRGARAGEGGPKQ